ncbi:hypothetical protein [Pistricoccus aurantiacus]|uniref:hypothetical protein n=1 Tax=Pistricoccus aurantiacus TaxID=1883414 RepID=UPI0036334B1B
MYFTFQQASGLGNYRVIETGVFNQVAGSIAIGFLTAFLAAFLKSLFNSAPFGGIDIKASSCPPRWHGLPVETPAFLSVATLSLKRHAT